MYLIDHLHDLCVSLCTSCFELNLSSMNIYIADNDKESLLGSLKVANLQFQKTCPGDKPDRQPVHTVYGGANLFKSDTCVKMGEVALKSLQTYSPNFAVLANVLQLQGHDRLPRQEKEVETLTEQLEVMSEADRKKQPSWLSY